MKIVVLGAPGAGKGTQAKKVAIRFFVPHISTGDILRSYIQEGTEVGKRAKKYIDKGFLVPDDLMINLVIERIHEEDCVEGYVLDGFPRTIPQAEAFEKILSAKGEQLDCVINVAVPDEDIVNRMAGRRACLACGATYHLAFMPPKREGTCDVCKGNLTLREDDEPKTVLKRLRVYHQQTEPLIVFYKKRGILQVVDGTEDIQDVFARIVDIVEQAAL